MTRQYTVFVLLPVYNGARYLVEQLDSILAQKWSGELVDNTRVVILCRDDASTDDSPALLRDYAAQYPDAIQLLRDEAGNLGAAGNFSALMQTADSEAMSQPDTRSYFALADQDDIWHVDKLQRCLTALLSVENDDGQVPVLVHSDLRVVDASGNLIADSFMSYQGLRPRRTSLSAQLLSNTLTGCTAMMNPALVRKALPVPVGAVMHDWWLSLIASAFGRRVYLEQPLMDYRQHDSNTIGARFHTRTACSGAVIRELLRTRQSPDKQQAFADIAAQAQAFMERHGSAITASQRFICRRIIALPSAGLWQQRVLFRLLRLF